MVELISDDVAVMYLGRIVESGPCEEVFANPRHPYTQALLSAAPQVDPSVTRPRVVLSGEPPNPENVPAGCAFHPRCPRVMEICRLNPPPAIRSGGVTTVCHLYGAH